MFYLKKLKLTNFRCYTQIEQEFSPTKNIIIGENAIGKTSLVEAIYFLCFGKSFREAKDIDIIKTNAEFYNIKGEFVDEIKKANDNVIIGYDKKCKKIQKNQNIYKNLSEYVGYFKSIIFSPDDLSFIKGGPIERRKFLDANISQLDSKYLKNLIEYKKILKQRNEFLKNSTLENYNKDLLTILNTSLVERAKIIIKAREELINKLNPYVKNNSLKISLGQEIVEMKYKPNTEVVNLEKNINAREKHDLFMQTTTVGPHRDDIEILINRQDAAIYGSQGQIKTAILAIKLGLTEFIKENDNKILIILDDVFSELDIDRQIALLLMINLGNQVFITTTDLNSIPLEVVGESKIIKLGKEGQQ